jgi:hypothetical protein
MSDVRSVRRHPRRAYNRPVLRRHHLSLVLRALAWSLTALILLTLAGSRLVAEEPWRDAAEVNVRYSIEARLRPGRGADERVRITGQQRIEWRNTSNEPVEVLYLHLYANAFRNTRSTFLREAAAGGWEPPEDMEFGGIDIQEIGLVADPEPLTLEFVQPDDGNADDRTVARVELPRPVQPGEPLGVKLRFTTTLPTIVARMGHKDEFVMAAQWYPKLGRYVGTDSTMPNVREGWYCHQYHRNTEFHADFADYDVELKVPSDRITGATGSRVFDETDERSLVRTERWEARSVVDFAFTADRRSTSDRRTATSRRRASPSACSGCGSDPTRTTR